MAEGSRRAAMQQNSYESATSAVRNYQTHPGGSGSAPGHEAPQRRFTKKCIHIIMFYTLLKKERLYLAGWPKPGFGCENELI